MRVFSVPERVKRWMTVGAVAAILVALTVIGIKNQAQAVSTTLPPQDRYSLRDVLTKKPVVALTFDISWGTVMPPKILHILEQQHVAATFFVSGPWAQQNPQIVRQMAKDGFEVESHGWAHVNYSELGAKGVADNIQKANGVIESLTGKHPTFVRPPNGDFNSTSIMAARSLGYTTVTWGTDSLDWMNPGVSTIVSRVTGRVHPGDIILMHASDTCKQTDLALPTILQDLRAKGYKFLTLSALIKEGTPNYRG